MPVWLSSDGDGSILTLHVQPGAKRTEVVGEHGDALKLRLAAPPIDGRANESLVAFVAETLDISRQSVVLISGQSSRRKRLRVALGTLDVQRRLLPA
jgi:uncharacterized protein (TIGR00251 family)